MRDDHEDLADAQKQKAGIDAEYGQEGDDMDEQMDDAQKSEDDSQLDERMQGMEEDEFLNDDLKMPSDLEGGDDEEESEEDGGLFPDDDQGSIHMPEDEDEDLQPKKKAKLIDSDEDEEKVFENVFKDANANQEMDIVGAMVNQKHGEYINQELVKRIEQIEDEMMNPKEWQLTGEARASDRPKDSLLQVHLDFNGATKLPPTITRETTNAIDALIK